MGGTYNNYWKREVAKEFLSWNIKTSEWLEDVEING